MKQIQEAVELFKKLEQENTKHCSEIAERNFRIQQRLSEIKCR